MKKWIGKRDNILVLFSHVKYVVTGAEFLFIFQSFLIVVALFLISHLLFDRPVEPASIFPLLFGLVILQLSNQVLLVIFGTYLVEVESIIIYIGPVIEETLKLAILIYVSIRTDPTRKYLAHMGFLVGLGFGLGEIIGYSVTFGTGILLQRSVLLIFGHPLYGVVISMALYYYSNAELSRAWRINGFLLLFISAVALHIFWNRIVVQSQSLITLPILLNLLIWYGIISWVHQQDHGVDSG